jgi:hypothetical protein
VAARAAGEVGVAEELLSEERRLEDELRMHPVSLDLNVHTGAIRRLGLHPVWLTPA